MVFFFSFWVVLLGPGISLTQRAPGWVKDGPSEGLEWTNQRRQFFVNWEATSDPKYGRAEGCMSMPLVDNSMSQAQRMRMER